MGMKMRFYPTALVCGLAGGLIVGMFIFQPKPDAPVPKEVPLEHVYHLPCRFEAESYEPSEVIDGIKFPMTCGCSEIKGTCFNREVVQYVLPDSYFKE